MFNFQTPIARAFAAQVLHAFADHLAQADAEEGRPRRQTAAKDARLSAMMFENLLKGKGESHVQ
jgi:hypothetical protein